MTSSSARPRLVLAMSAEVCGELLDPVVVRRLAAVAEFDPGLVVTDFADPAVREALAGAEALLTGWGCPPLTGEALDRMPALRTVVHAAGSVKHHVTTACWERGLTVASAAAANAVPVAEYTVAAILFAGKGVLAAAHAYRRDRRPPAGPAAFGRVGNFGRTVGVVGASRIGRRVIELLRPFDLRVLLHDPYLTKDQVRELGAEPAGLDELARRSDVVTLHAPELPSTRHLFDAARLALLPDGATLVNTARGSLVDTEALTAELVRGRLHAVLDHTEPEVLPPGSPLYELPNVLLTPHVAGSLGNELSRLAHAAVAELERYAAGLPYADPVRPETLSRSA
ncbi:MULTISPECIES: hydroxyacid dehydrogenase [Streptomycetaceae]|uniref:2-hydroxyacid-family dehydrogenase n=1 Tax=Streptantibioticus cattleyicolor (strain ATCC 35852 / DSM 46488 / JCM 4925 / NBRC 14057 / NRRL 8057) TaxID=1003195 RepID=F8JSJ6_STREN|nr:MULTISPECIES: hydroxyacid dehydrogenase [Streptomycetaceae]AEW96721.1 2-hydroxyacid-family dehydrogenase [Streptantibioticus cattleyicolor NRRL 8057 = DSM 46488]MYS61209.1 hydroxyacid dehydrogenase [Streptomyces sp. SID5468]CCB77058.1 2-hydroxyacid-family dehydrogenase [Streptantibioticus cattleyicolor NRRL 8057 = DSM 46488]